MAVNIILLIKEVNMSYIKIEKAIQEDYDEVIHLANYVFSMVRSPIDFPAILPKLYKREYFMDGITYIIRENGRIIAVTGAYPIKIEFPDGDALHGRGIGMVAVHPNCRSRGYMKELMIEALDDMKKDGISFSCLGGRRQRYETYGYTHAGSNYSFSVNEDNIHHTLGRDRKNNLNIKLVNSDDEKTLDQIHALHEIKSVRMYRNREKLFDILSSWKAKVFSIWEGDNFEGYLIYRPATHDISEINMKNISRIGEAVDLILRQRRDNYFTEAPVLGSIQIMAGPNETEKLAALSGLAETCSLSNAFQFAILDFKKFTEPFLKHKVRQCRIENGSFAFNINNHAKEYNAYYSNYEIKEKLLLRSGFNGAEISDNTSEKSLLELNTVQAVRFLFSPFSDHSFPAIRENLFLQSILPFPLFFENVDGV